MLRVGGARRAKTRERTVSLPAVALLTRNLATMLDAGLPLRHSLEVAGAGSARTPESRLARRLQTEVESGRSLSNAMRDFGRPFDTFSIGVVRAGETSGTLAPALSRVADQIDRRVALRRTLWGAATYPAIVLLVAMAACALLLLFVIPIFTEIFEAAGQELPGPTRMVIAASRALTAGLPVFAGLAVLVAAAGVALSRQPVVRQRTQELLLAVPLIGPIIRVGAVADALQTLATLVQGEVPLLDALRIASESAGHPTIASVLRTAHTEVGHGGGFAEALRRSPHFPAHSTQMIAAGESCGALGTMLEQAANVLREDMERSIRVATALLEPAIVLGLAVGVGGVVLSMYLPVFRLGSVF